MAMYKIALTAAAVLILSACGGGGGSSSPNTDSTEKPGPNQSSLSNVPTAYQSAVKQAKDFAPYEDSDLIYTQLTIDGKTVRHDEKIDFSSLKDGFSDKKVTLNYQDDSGRKGNAEATMKIYQQPYSMVIGTLVTKDSLNLSETGRLSIDHVRGLTTTEQGLPTTGTFTYNGVAFSDKEQGTLSYNVDFDARTGSGAISGLNTYGQITLAKGHINKAMNQDMVGMGIMGQMSASKQPNGGGFYELGFFGPNAEEIAGAAYYGDIVNTEIGFAGKR
ncbi:factor H binding protein domain-containing protein [Neisseriaceae bacterium CLB008]